MLVTAGRRVSTDREPDHNLAFGRVLADLRRHRSLSQEKLGFDANLDRSYISLLERGKRSPTLDTIISLCRVLHIQFGDLSRLVEAKLEEMDAKEP